MACSVCGDPGHNRRTHTAHQEPQVESLPMGDDSQAVGRQLNGLDQPAPLLRTDPACPNCGRMMDTVFGETTYRCRSCGCVLAADGSWSIEAKSVQGETVIVIEPDPLPVVGPLVGAIPDENPQPNQETPVTPRMTVVGEQGPEPLQTPGEDALTVLGPTSIIFVCATCGAPVESEPCQQHQPRAWAEAVKGTVLDPEALPTPPWRTVLGPDEPIRIAEPGVYVLTADEYHDPAITGEWMSNSDGKKLLETCPAQFKWDRDHGVRKTSDAFDFGHVAHTVVLGRGEAFQIFEPCKLDGRTREGKAQKLEVDAARAAGRTPIYGDQWATITAMVEAIQANQQAAELLAQSGRAEACLFWRDQVKVDGVWVTVQRRAMVDLLPDVPEVGGWMRVVDYKTADAIAPNDDMRRKIYDYGYHRQGATLRDACRALFDRPAEVLFVMQSKRAPHFVVSVDLDTPAQMIGATQNDEALKLWARAQLTGVWPEYAEGVVTSGVPAWVEHQYEDEIGVF
jgi:PDDEXK-like uncharacterized protein DUF3799